MNAPHPLFLPEDDDDAPEVGFIHVTRFDKLKGKFVYAPTLYAAEELESLEELFERYGGGFYELVARDKLKRGVTARRRYELDGKPRPLSEPEETDTGGPPPMPVASAGPNLGGIMPILLTFAPLVVDWLKSSAATARATAEQQTNLMLAMMNRDAENARAHVLQMQALHDRQAASQSELFCVLLEKSSSGDPAELLMRGLEMGTGMVQGAQEAATHHEDTIGEFASGVGTVVEQLQKIKALDGEAPGASAAPTAPPKARPVVQRQAGPPPATPPNGPTPKVA
jgi:hypothetical protein